MMTPRERILCGLRGEKTDLISFSMYDAFSPMCNDIDSLLHRGMGMVVHMSYSAKIWMENVDIRHVEYTEGTHRMTRTTYSTPVGEVYTVQSEGKNNPWTHEHMFKSPEDYKVLHYMLSNQRCSAEYEPLLKKMETLGENYILRDQLPLEPLQQLITSDMMDVMTFSMEWIENRDEILKLYEVNAKFHEQLYEIVANGPLDFANYGGNVIPMVIGPDVFREYYIPHYNLAADILNSKGKFIGSHLDADNTVIMDLIGDTKLNYIEAYDPSISPSLKVAKEKFPDKVMWINWPSGEHHRGINDVDGITKALIEDHGSDKDLMIAITEDLPEGKWDSFLHAILDALSYPS